MESNKSWWAKSRNPFIVGVLALTIVASLLMASAAERINEKTALTMFGTYASLRVINAALSTAQEAEFSANAVVVGGSAKPLKILEPLDDFIEQMASIVLLVAIFSGILSVGLCPVVTLGAVLLVAAAVLRIFSREETWSWSLERAVLWPGLFLGLVIPATFVFSPVVSDLATQSKWEEAMTALTAFEAKSEKFVEQQEVASADEGAEADGFIAGLRNLGSSVADGIGDGLSRTGDVMSAGRDYVQNADELVRAVLVIGSIVLLKLFILPIISVVICLSLMRHVLQR